MRLLIGLLIVFALGCRRVPEPSKAGAAMPPPEKSTADTLIDGFTDKTAVDAGERAKAKIREVSAQERKDLDEAMGK